MSHHEKKNLIYMISRVFGLDIFLIFWPTVRTNKQASINFPKSALLFTGFTFHQMLSLYCKENRGFTEKHYVVVADIKDAYGSINHNKMETILKYVVRKLPSDIYIHEVKYRYISSSKILSRTLASPNKNLEIDEIPLVRGAQYVGQENAVRMESKSAIMTVAKRIRLHTIGFKMGSKKRIYSVKQGILQGKKLVKENY